MRLPDIYNRFGWNHGVGRGSTLTEKIILYGTGLEGEKFYCKYSCDFHIVYCLDQRRRQKFHNKEVFRLEEKIEEINKYHIMIAAGFPAYKEIRKHLIDIGLKEYRDFTHTYAIGKKIAFIYGNCHMGALSVYLNLNYEFYKQYYLKLYSITEDGSPTQDELEYCDLLITQDIRKDNNLGKASCQELIAKHTVGTNIVVPNIYGCNMFFPQINYAFCPFDNTSRIAYMDRHLNSEAIDAESLNEPGKTSAQNFTQMTRGRGDAYIDTKFYEGASIEEIKKDILEKQIWTATEIQSNFDTELNKIKSREKDCDFIISDIIENYYQKRRLFFSPSHPTGFVTQIKGIRILEILGLESEKIDFDNGLGADELPIYGCVKRALGLQFEQKILRKNSQWTLGNQPETLSEYIENYIRWVWGGDADK